MPIRRVRGHAAAPPSSVTNSRRFSRSICMRFLASLGAIARIPISPMLVSG
jgi:hypothetical protein